METRTHHRGRQLVLALCTLLTVIIAPLMSTTSYAAVAPNLGTTPSGQGQSAVVINPGVTLPASTQFDLTGFIQAATLNTPGDVHSGGTVTVNGIKVTVPRETIVILPANALTWQEIFAQAPTPYGPSQTGLAIADTPAPISTYEMNVIGNRVGDQYIAGLVHISQNDLNSGAGYINYIDYTTGEFRVGGKIVYDASGNPTLDANNPGTRVRINDPLGRFGRAGSPDGRFTVDPENPTIAAGTGFPMCIPRTNPANSDDPLCPQGNRRLDPTQPGGFSTAFQMSDPALVGVFPDAHFQAPFEVGDYVNFAGTLMNDTATPSQAVLGATTYVSAHTVIGNLSILTFPGTNPAYVSIEVGLIGTGGLTVFGAGEAAARTKFEGMTTDPTRNIHLYGVDVSPTTGATTDRDWGTIGVDPGPPNGAVSGRWRYRPPCKATAGTVSDKDCSPPPAGTFLPPPREVRAVLEGLQSQVPGLATAQVAANGIYYGQYHAPIGEYIFPENVPGAPIPENNFNTIDFLALGGYSSSTGVVAGVLSPWPSNVLPTPSCVTPAPSAAGPYSVALNGTVALSGSSTGTAPITFAWITSAGTLTNSNTATPTFNASGLAAGTVANLTLTATNACGNASAATTVTVSSSGTPTVSPIAPVTALSGTATVTFPIQATLNGDTFTVAQSPAGTLGGLTVTGTQNATNPTRTTATVRFSAPALPVGQVTPTIVTVTVTAKNGTNTSQPISTTVTISPQADSITITNAEYRTGKQRLILSVTSSVVSPNVILTLQPYKTTTGTIFNPATLGATLTNTGGGIYTFDLVGAPQPGTGLVLTVKSNLNGTSPAHGLDRIRA